MIPFTLNAADIGVVSLGSEAATLSVPSKTYSLMSVGAPILAIAKPNAELKRLVDKYALGQSFEPNQLENMLEFLLKCINDTEFFNELQRNALKASKDFTDDNAKMIVNELTLQ